MFRLIESIRVQHRQAQNLAFHQARINKTQQAVFQDFIPIHLEQLLQASLVRLAPDLVYKCRIVYGQEVEKMEFRPYKLRPINRLKIVHDNEISYGCKWENRTGLKQLLAQKGACDDVLIIKNGLVTDTSYANILFYDGEKWLTPNRPLLAGTQRAKLLYRKQVKAVEIKVTDIPKFKYFKLVNAMLPYEMAKTLAISHIQ